MNLGELIKRLKKEPQDKLVMDGFDSPHSYRGFYHELAFTPKMHVTVGSMLQHAKSALNATFTGYKGGEYKMDKFTKVNIADYGDAGDYDDLTEERLENMLSPVNNDGNSQDEELVLAWNTCGEHETRANIAEAKIVKLKKELSKTRAHVKRLETGIVKVAALTGWAPSSDIEAIVDDALKG